MIDVDEQHDAIFDLETVVDFSDPLEVVELAFTQGTVAFPEPAEYRLQLFGAGEPLVERWVQISSKSDEER